MINPATGEVVVDEDGKPVVDPAQIESWCEYVNQRVAPKQAPAVGQIKTPDSIVQDLEMLGHLASQNVRILREADRTRRAVKRMLTRARLTARAGTTGKDADTRAEEVAVASMAEWEISDNAEVAYEYAKNLAQLTRDRTSAVQTQSKQVELTYHLAGRETGR